MHKFTNPQTVAFVQQFCATHLVQYGFIALYLIGSRATGNHREDSDHDFLAVVSDAAPPEIATGASLHTTLFNQLNSERAKAELGGIDLVIQRQNHYNTSALTPGTFAYAAANTGILLSKAQTEA